MHQSQFGRTMLETISVMTIIGVLSVTGIYMYRQAMNGVKADGIIKDVLARASQVKSNADLNRSGVGVKKDNDGNIVSVKKRVYTPEYKKTTSDTTKGRYGYSYKLIDACTSEHDVSCSRSYVKKKNSSEYVVIELTNGITPAVCESVKGKLTAYDGRYPKVVCMYNKSDGAFIDNGVTTCKTHNVNIIKESGEHSECSDTDLSRLYFTVEYR